LIKWIFLLLLVSILIPKIYRESIEPSEKSCLEEKILLSQQIDVSFKNFTEDEMKVVIIKHIRDKKILETWTLYPKDKYIEIPKTFYVNDIYEFYIKGKEPYILQNMKNIFYKNHEGFSGSNECYADKYWIDGLSNGGFVIPYGK
jgi:hypothetical protein